MDNIKKILNNEENEINKSLKELFNSFSITIEEKNKKNKAVLSKIRVIFDLKHIYIVRENNKIIKKLLKKLIKVLKTTKNEKYIDSKNMAAFKVVALELEQKEKIIDENNKTIKKYELEIDELNQNILSIEKENDFLRDNIKTLNNKNEELIEINSFQLKTIDKLKYDLDNKTKSINDLKENFMGIIEKYNDILVEVY